MAMKKILICLLLSPFTFHLSPCQAQGAWNLKRFNLAVDFAYRPTQLELGTGLFTSHPERALHVGVNYRLLRHWELGFYLGFQGCQFYGFSKQSIGSTSVASISYENGFYVNYGFLVQLHAMSFEKRSNSWADIMLRLGVGQGYEEDGAWAGFGVVWNATNHLSIQLNTDFGGWFGNNHLYDANYSDNSTACLRSSIGIILKL